MKECTAPKSEYKCINCITYNSYAKNEKIRENHSALKRGCFPRRWKVAKIIPIPKPGKENSKDPSKYRPISLINIEGKVLEKLLITRINHHLHKNGVLANS
jgi:hypothetical protein